MARQGTIGQPITLRAKFMDTQLSSTILFDPFSIEDVKIYTSAVGGTLLATITPTRVSTGIWQIVYNIPSSLSPTTLYDQWSWHATSDMPLSVPPRFHFEIIAPTPIPPTPPEPVTFAVCKPKPTWEQYVGLRLAEDVGNGMGINLTWLDAMPSDIHQELFYNIYYSTTRFGVFDAQPKDVTTDTFATINIAPGKAYYIAVRAAQMTDGYFDITGLQQVGPNLYQYPAQQILEDNLDAYGVAVQVASTMGYPPTGTLIVGSDAYGFELMRYHSKDGYNFYVDDIDRGEYGTLPSNHSIGEIVNLWHGFEDGNTNIVQATADWFYTNGTPRNIDAYGQPNVDEDGYRAALEDDITTDLVASETNTENFSPYDYNSYHRPSIQDSFNGSCVGSYLGGEFNGLRGFNFQDRILSQLDAMLQVTGEPVIVLRRKWTGKRCQCISLRREHQRSRCTLCYNTGFVGGYDRLFNNRAISESFVNDAGMFMLRTSPYPDDLELVQDQGLRQPDEIAMWTLTVPNIKDRDIIIRFTEDGLEEFRYVVLNVTRNKLMFNQTGRQDIKMRRLDKTDQIYQYQTNDPNLFVIV